VKRSKLKPARSGEGALGFGLGADELGVALGADEGVAAGRGRALVPAPLVLAGVVRAAEPPLLVRALLGAVPVVPAGRDGALAALRVAVSAAASRDSSNSKKPILNSCNAWAREQ
jgi:hypothetical protein